MMKQAVLAGVAVILVLSGAFIGLRYTGTGETDTVTPIGKLSGEDPALVRPLEKYEIEKLAVRQYTGSPIELDDAVATTPAFTAYMFHFTSDGKKVTGLAHIPKSDDPTRKFPVIVQFRGYVDRSIYESGVGTRHSAEVFAANGFISLAPDFLGYGKSDMPSGDPFEERFETYTTAANMIAAAGTLPMADSSHLFLWGHSNGGHITMTVLEILGKPIPSALWAPVSKPFPYSILYYTDDADDGGKSLRFALAKFEKDYDTDKYSTPRFLSRITAPLQIHQGSDDEAVPRIWSDNLVQNLKSEGKNVEYFVYPGADHNLNGAWNTVMQRNLQFYRSFLK